MLIDARSLVYLLFNMCDKPLSKTGFYLVYFLIITFICLFATLRRCDFALRLCLTNKTTISGVL